MYRTIAIGICVTLLAITGSLAAGCGLKKKSDPSADFLFATDPASSYVRVDRVGMPAVATAVITSKDSYNEASPVDDASGLFVPQIQANVATIHAKLDDDITAAGLTPASTATSIAQAAPLIVPDTLKIDTAASSGFPNGRKLPDPVVDVTLAVVLLDLGVGGQSATTLAGLPLNPPANDKPFSSSFPYLASAH
jgi:hypothetical protein